MSWRKSRLIPKERDIPGRGNGIQKCKVQKRKIVAVLQLLGAIDMIPIQEIFTSPLASWGTSIDKQLNFG